MAAPPFASDEAALLRSLVESRVEFLVVGLAAAALQGAPVVTQTVDLWIPHREDPPGSSNPPLLVGPGAELFDLVVHMHGLGSFDREKAHAIRIRLGDVEVPVLSLERIIASKRATNRPKDRAILPALEDALRTIRQRPDDSGDPG